MNGLIVVVEDDYLQEGPVQDHLQDAFPGVQVRTICTESEFREAIPELREAVPDIVIMDVMLRWAFPGPGAPAPPPDVQEGYFRAGLRCAALLSGDDRLSSVPVILYSILERSDLDRDDDARSELGAYVRKSADLEVLTRKVRELTSLAR